MNNYRNAANDRTLQVWADSTLKVVPDNPALEARTFTVRPEDTDRLIADLTRDTLLPEGYETAEVMADDYTLTDDYLRVRVAMCAHALAIRAERADQKTKAEAEDAAKLDAEAEELFDARYGEGAWKTTYEGNRESWRNVARVARQIHAPNGDPEVAR